MQQEKNRLLTMVCSKEGRFGKWFGTVALCCCFYGVFSGTAFAAPIDNQSFSEFLNSFYSEAAKKGISRSTYDQALAGVTAPDATILKKAEYQPEFTTEI